MRQVPKRPAIYARISLDKKGEYRNVKRQIRDCFGHAAKIGWTVSDDRVYYDNDISAKSGKPRPGFERLLVDIVSGEVDGLVAVHLDRLLRRVLDLERVLDAIHAAEKLHRVHVHVSFENAGDFDLSTSGGRMLARILTSVASNESEQKGERVRSARRAEAVAGKAHTALGYGYNADQSINPDEAAVIKDVAQRILDGQTLFSVATRLNEAGVPTPGADTWTSRHVAKEASKEDADPAFVAFVAACRQEEPTPPKVIVRLLRGIGSTQDDGSQWTVKAVRVHPDLTRWLLDDDSTASDGDIGVVLNRVNVPPPPMQWRLANLRSMIRRSTLCGWRDHGVGLRGEDGEMVAKGQWTPILAKGTTEAIRERLDKAERVTGGRKPKHLLTTIAKCGRCGAPLSGSYDSRAKTARYACSQQPGLTERCGRLTAVADPVERAVTTALLRRISRTPLTAQRRTRTSGARAVTEQDIAQAEVDLQQVKDLTKTYRQMAVDGEIDPEEWKDFREGLKMRQKKAETVIGEFAPNTQAVLPGVPRQLADLERYWETASFERKREIVLMFIEKVVIAPATRGGNQFDYDRIGIPVWWF